MRNEDFFNESLVKRKMAIPKIVVTKESKEKTHIDKIYY